MSEVPHRQAGETTLDLRRQQGQPCCGVIRELRRVELLHDERRLLTELGRLRTQIGAIQLVAGVFAPRKCGRSECYNFLLRAVGVVQW
jgi:hypothetical protein